ncbi:hypothetical protein RKE25_19915 [Dyella sp. BiH032]|uniref:hypothetical protein n=1 Tax=Dyella sp. BiH032 TaxID=3075430 RepID=UPI0028931295|nr:hypothetical protein [Dyella sp. BiH032]WNL45652.1 hypothetical protein RKE25_19915 [Dyella sp. BiH032]
MNDRSSKRPQFSPQALLGFVVICITLGFCVAFASPSLDRVRAYLYLGLYGLVALNAAVTWAVAIDQGLLLRQKVGQALVVWLLPVLGGLVIGIFMWTQRGSAPPTGYPSDSDRGPRDVYMGSHPPGPPGGC